MSTTSTKPDPAKALAGPPQRPRAGRDDLPKPPGAGGSTEKASGQKEAEAEALRRQQQEANAAAERKRQEDAEAEARQKQQDEADAESQRQQQEAETKRVQPRPEVSKARRLLAARNAEQTFLPLVSRVAKLNEWVEQAELAIEDALSNGVDAEVLEDTLCSVARKNDVPWSNLPETITRAIKPA